MARARPRLIVVRRTMRATRVIATSEQDGVLQAVMCDPPDNSPRPSLLGALAELVDEFEHGSARVLLLSSSLPGCFAGDGGLDPASPATIEELADNYAAIRRPLERLAACRKPSIAAIDGTAIGFGLQLAMACTLRFSTPGAELGLSEVRRGRIPAAGGTQRLPRLIGPGRALDLMLSGRVISGTEAHRIGLVERVIPDLAGDVPQIAASIAQSAAPAMASIMSCVDAAMELPHEQGMAVERAAVVSAMDEAAGREGIRARDRRPGAAPFK